VPISVPTPVYHAVHALLPEISPTTSSTAEAGDSPLFEKPADYVASEKILAKAHAQTRIRIATYCLMPNHWHLLLWPRHDGELSEVLR
jgi:hypothetical protein